MRVLCTFVPSAMAWLTAGIEMVHHMVMMIDRADFMQALIPHIMITLSYYNQLPTNIDLFNFCSLLHRAIQLRFRATAINTHQQTRDSLVQKVKHALGFP